MTLNKLLANSILLLLLGACGNRLTATAVVPDAQQSAAASPQPNLVQLYRFARTGALSDHILSSNQTENPTGYPLEGPVFKLFAAPADATLAGCTSPVKLYRCVYNGFHFISNQPTCGTYTADPVAASVGFACTTEASGLRPAWRIFKETGAINTPSYDLDRLYTHSWTEVQYAVIKLGYTLEIDQTVFIP